jgi:hypothetical protein
MTVAKLLICDGVEQDQVKLTRTGTDKFAAAKKWRRFCAAQTATCSSSFYETLRLAIPALEEYSLLITTRFYDDRR